MRVLLCKTFRNYSLKKDTLRCPFCWLTQFAPTLFYSIKLDNGRHIVASEQV